MTWWAWVLVYLGLLVAAAVLGFVQVRTLWRKASALLGELAIAGGRLQRISDQLAELQVRQPMPSTPRLAVFDDPARLRRARDRDIRARVRRGRAAARRRTPR